MAWKKLETLANEPGIGPDIGGIRLLARSQQNDRTPTPETSHTPPCTVVFVVVR